MILRRNERPFNTDRADLSVALVFCTTYLLAKVAVTHGLRGFLIL